jgi:multisubunit Na+/H+ antiporter MnhB subunit
MSPMEARATIIRRGISPIAASAILLRHAERREQLRARARTRWTERLLVAVAVGVVLTVLAGAFAFGVSLRQLMR